MFAAHNEARLLTQAPGGATLQGRQGADDTLPQHSLIQSVWLYLLPGALIVLFAIAAGFIASKVELPSLLVPSLWVLLVLIPFELGYLLVEGKKRNGKFSLRGIVLYREPLPVKWYLLLVPALMVWAMISFLVIAPGAQAYPLYQQAPEAVASLVLSGGQVHPNRFSCFSWRYLTYVSESREIT